MAAILASLVAFFTSFPRIATALLWVLLLARADAQNEVQVLLKFRSVMDVDSAPIGTGYWSTWNETDGNPCDWWGVTCTSKFTVMGLDLSGWGLTRLPSLKVLSNLPDLRELDLSFNNFQINTTSYLGISIPDDVGSLTRLTKLSLQVNNFIGSIPSTIPASCLDLQYLNLESNKLTGEIPNLTSLKNLTYLYLKQNQLSGPFPEWLGQLNSLQVIELMYNMFSGTIPSLPNLANLYEIMLDSNNFTHFQEPLFPGSKRLIHLSVASNQLVGRIPDSITKLLSLKVLDLSGNQLSGPIPSGFSLNMSEGVKLDLHSNQLNGSIPPNLLQPTTFAINLPFLDFSNNLLTGPIPFDGTKQYNYQYLYFNNNSLTGNIPSICKSGNTIINHLNLNSNNLSGDIIDFFVDCYDYVSELRLANNSFSGDLSKIGYRNTSFNSALRMANLQEGIRDLSHNNLQMRPTEENPDPLRDFLEFFVMSTPLVEFHLQGNKFSGSPLPADFNSSASALQILDLSDSHLIGEISGAAFNSTWFPALQSLNLSNNDIEGPVPEAIVMLPNLADLDVTNNGLSGPLPTIPGWLSPSSFAGNGGLCGDPLRACSQGSGVQWWVLLIVIGGSVTIAISSCLVVTWRWRVYRKMHQQDADLIKALLERETATVMSLRSLKKATNNFAESTQIGEGGFGNVYTGKLNDGTVVAVKKAKCEGTESDKEMFLNEVNILSRINHRHLVKLLGCCMENKIALLVFEFISNGTLQQHLQGKIGEKRLSWDQRLRIVVQTADALNYLHSAASFPIYHRDIKPANILIDGSLNAKVSDFGISKLVPLEVTHVSTRAVQGTIGYIDPEYYTSYQLTGKSDVYSFGVVLLELISAKPAIDFLRGGDNTGLVGFAKPYIESGDLQHFIDVALVPTYNDLAYPGRKSILDVGRLAMKCLLMQSQERPSMHDVWKELQSIQLEFRGTSKEVSSFNEDGNKDTHDQIVLLSENSISRLSSVPSLPNDAAVSIQMSSLLR